MAKAKGMTTNEVFFRQWWAVKSNGFQFENSANYSIKQGISDIRNTFNKDNEGERSITYPTCKTYLDRLIAEVKESGSFELHLDVQNFDFEINQEIVDYTKSDVNSKIEVGSTASNINAHTNDIMQSLSDVMDISDDICAEELGDMDFGHYDFYQTDTILDRIMSDTVDGIGLTSRNLIMAFGESGVGKSTQLLDLVALNKLNPNNPIGKHYCYVSTEMMKSDLKFYVEKNPMAKHVPTISLMNYIIAGKAVDSLIQIFLSDKFDFIILDSFQDLIIKLCQYCGMKMNDATNMLLNLLVASAEKYNKTIIVIQHQTKGGDFVGGSFLKHTVTAMLEYRFDGVDRYLTFSKNRRGGDVQNLRVYYSLDKQTEKVIYDNKRFQDQLDARNISKEETKKQMLGNLSELLKSQEVKIEDDIIDFDSFTQNEETFDIEAEEIIETSEIESPQLSQLNMAIAQA